MTTNVDLEKLQKDAVDIFNQGFACSESVIYAIKENFELDMSDDAIAWRRRMYLRCACRSNHVHRLLFRTEDTGRS